METFYIKKLQELKKNKKELEDKLRLKINISKNIVSIDGEAFDEFASAPIFEALAFGFSLKRSLLLTNEDYILRIIKIKEHTRRNISEIKSRLIGKKGKTRRVFADTSGCEILIADSEVGVIGDVLSVEGVETAIVGLIRGSKQTNMYKFLEKQNKRKKENTSLEDQIGRV